MSYNRYKNTQKRKNYLLIHNKEKRLGQNPTLNRKTSGVLPSGKFPLVF